MEKNGSGGSYRFQVNLGGIIDLLSNHLYSSPQVYVRELLQNATDALTARRLLEPNHSGGIRIEVGNPSEQGRPWVAFVDDGIGLTEAELHEFLATIGQTSKREDLAAKRGDFIGQFGIGLLSCFLVSDEIVVRTRSARSGGSSLEWRGRADGTYTIQTPEEETPVGTRVLLLSKPGFEQYFEPELVLKLVSNYGGLLPHPVLLSAREETTLVNPEPPPWAVWFADPSEERETYLRFGREVFETDFTDYVPLRSEFGGVEGVAFVLPHTLGVASKKTDRVYLKGMLLSEEAEGLLPDWAFFVKCIIDARDLRPSASRETFYEDVMLRAVRKELGQCLKRRLLQLAADDPRALRELISTHSFSIKALSAEDDECFLTFRDWLPFETNMGQMTLGDLLQQSDAVRYVTNLDEFRQVSAVAAAQDLCLVNGVYAFDQALLAKLADASPEVVVERVDAASLTMSFGHLLPAEEEMLDGFVGLAREALAEFGCEVQVRRFEPRDVPAVYLAGSDALFHRAVEESKEAADPLWSSLLDGVAGARPAAAARLCLNLSNQLVSRVVRIDDSRRLQVYVRMLYLQALLLGHRPPGRRELKALNDTLTWMLEDGAGSETGRAS